MSEEQFLLPRVDEDDEEQRTRTNTSISQDPGAELGLGTWDWAGTGEAGSQMRQGARALVQAFGERGRASLAMIMRAGEGPGPGTFEGQGQEHRGDSSDGEREIDMCPFVNVNADPFRPPPRCSLISRTLSLADPRRIDDMLHLAELCIELLQQNEEHYSEACPSFAALFLSDPYCYLFLNYLSVSSPLIIPQLRVHMYKIYYKLHTPLLVLV